MKRADNSPRNVVKAPFRIALHFVKYARKGQYRSSPDCPSAGRDSVRCDHGAILSHYFRCEFPCLHTTLRQGYESRAGWELPADSRSIHETKSIIRSMPARGERRSPRTRKHASSRFWMKRALIHSPRRRQNLSRHVSCECWNPISNLREGLGNRFPPRSFLSNSVEKLANLKCSFRISPPTIDKDWCNPN
jgi:hypothetical protein